jgi:hypothetical protein
MSQTAKKETVLFLTERTRRDPRPLPEKCTAPARIFSGRSHVFEATR